jgi:hypothetical protein
MVLGAAAGGAVLAVVAVLDGPDPCQPQRFCLVLFSAPERAVMGLALGAMIGAPAGLLIDLFLPSSRTVYRAPGLPAQLSLAPILTPGAIGGRAAITW